MLQYNKHLLSIASKLPLWRCVAALSNSPSTSPTSQTALGEDEEEKVGVKEAIQMNVKLVENINTSLVSKITSDKSINYLLDIAHEPGMTGELGTKILSIITNKINSGEAKVRDIFTDKRFLKLQQIILQHDSPKKSDSAKSRNSSKQTLDYSKYSTSALIGIMKQLAIEKKRDLTVLMSLAINMCKDDRIMSVRQCTDILYCMATLTFCHEVLMTKIVAFLVKSLPNVNDKKIISSTLTSMGMLRYKDPTLLNTLYSKPVLVDPVYRYNVLSAIQTAATLDYTSESVMILAENVSRVYKKTDFASLAMWIDLVWSLIILKMHTELHLSSVLEEDLSLLGNLTVSKKLKVLNINGVASSLPNYQGRILDQNQICSLNAKLSRNSEQEQRTEALAKNLEAIMPSKEHFTTNIDTNMGFYIDAECHYDKETNAVKIDPMNAMNPKINRIAIMLHNFTDYTYGPNKALIGQVNLYKKLLQNKKYTVVSIPHEQYNLEDSEDLQQEYIKKRIGEALRGSALI